jgi:hypothetical protein
LLELGRGYHLEVELGGVAVPEALAPAVNAVKSLAQRLREQEQDLAALEKEHPSGS